MKNFQDLETRLMGEFTVESMMGGDITLEKMPQPSSDFNIAAIQQQAGTWCLQSKGLLFTDKVSPLSSQGMFAAQIKAHALRYANSSMGSNNAAMKYLIADSDMENIVHQISMLTKISLYKDVSDIFNVPDEIRKNSLNPEHVSVPMAVYTFFTLLVNDNIADNQFDDLFIQSWYNYFEVWQARELMLQMGGLRWKENFKEVLLI